MVISKLNRVRKGRARWVTTVENVVSLQLSSNWNPGMVRADRRGSPTSPHIRSTVAYPSLLSGYPQSFAHRLANRYEGVLLGCSGPEHSVMGNGHCQMCVGIRPADGTTGTGMAKSARVSTRRHSSGSDRGCGSWPRRRGRGVATHVRRDRPSDSSGHKGEMGETRSSPAYRHLRRGCLGLSARRSRCHL